MTHVIRDIRSHLFLPLLNYELKTEHEKYVIQTPKKQSYIIRI